MLVLDICGWGPQKTRITNTHLKEKLWTKVKRAKERDPREGEKAKAKIFFFFSVHQ